MTAAGAGMPFQKRRKKKSTEKHWNTCRNTLLGLFVEESPWHGQMHQAMLIAATDDGGGRAASFVWEPWDPVGKPASRLRTASCLCAMCPLPIYSVTAPYWVYEGTFGHVGCVPKSPKTRVWAAVCI